MAPSNSISGSCIVKSLIELDLFAAKLVGRFGPKQLVLLSGPLGSGKTALAKAVSKALNVEQTSSPTYAIHQRYVGDRVIDHVDLYRLEDANDLESSGFWDLFMAAEGLILIEWADRVDLAAWPLDWPRISLEITVNAGGFRHIVQS